MAASLRALLLSQPRPVPHTRYRTQCFVRAEHHIVGNAHRLLVNRKPSAGKVVLPTPPFHGGTRVITKHSVITHAVVEWIDGDALRPRKHLRYELDHQRWGTLPAR